MRFGYRVSVFYKTDFIRFIKIQLLFYKRKKINNLIHSAIFSVKSLLMFLRFLLTGYRTCYGSPF